jgi:hypothetical protein
MSISTKNFQLESKIEIEPKTPPPKKTIFEKFRRAVVKHSSKNLFMFKDLAETFIPAKVSH